VDGQVVARLATVAETGIVDDSRAAQDAGDASVRAVHVVLPFVSGDVDPGFGSR
jgi:hypothetical protein